jgi:hypothetical protein
MGADRLALKLGTVEENRIEGARRRFNSIELNQKQLSGCGGVPHFTAHLARGAIANQVGNLTQ